MKKLILLFLSFLFMGTKLSAQEAPKVRFEKVSDEEMSMKTYPNDTTAEAVILYDEGLSRVRYDLTSGFTLTYERFVRIKILKPGGVNWGNFMISIYSTTKSHEDIQQIKGTTFNLENGKIVRSELKKDAIFRERENKYWETVRLSMPAVKVGSVIDLRYGVSSDLTWNLRPWKFQYTIPVKWSQYRVIYPEYYTYNFTVLGYHPLLYNKQSQNTESISYSETVDNSGGSSRYIPNTNLESRTISYLNKIFDYAANDVPAVKSEPYLTTLDNYTTQVKFELSNANFAAVGGRYKDYTASWKDVALDLANDENFGFQLKNDNFAEDIVNQLTKGISDNLGKLNAIYGHVQQTMKWDGYKSVFTGKTLKKVYSDKSGNSSEINLLLTLMLNKAGITAHPVILSTRQHGIISLNHATITDCNYVIVMAVVDNRPILLDATEPNLQLGYVPFRCLNGEGHLVTKDNSDAIPIQDPRSGETTVVKLEMTGGKVGGTISKRISGLSAFDFREAVKSAGGKKEFFDKLKNSSADLDYFGYQYLNLDSLNQTVGVEYKIALKEGQERNAGIVYIDPVITNRLKDNPFTLPVREYPVDFGVQSTESYNCQLTVPEGYKVEELPKSMSLLLENKGGQFQYQVTQVDNKVLLSLRILINKAFFLPSEYQSLKSFYNSIINKESEQIILKKI